MSLNIFGKKCLQRRCPLRACDAGHSEHLFFACNASSSPPNRSTAPCSSPNLARPGERISLSSPLALPGRQGVPSFVQTPPGFEPFSRSRAHKDVERLSLHEGHQHCVQLICHIRSVSRGIKTSIAAFASVTVADSLSTAPVKTSLAPGCTLTTKFSVRRAQDRNSLSVLFSGGGLTRASRDHQGWIGSCWIRSGCHCRAHCLIVANLSRLGRGLAVEHA